MTNTSVVTSGKNTDGLDPDSVWNMYIAENYFSNGDDNIAVKSGRDWSGRMVNISSRNILAENNVYATGHAGFAIGSETSGWVYDVVSRDSVHLNNDKAVRIKSARGRGGGARNVTYANLTGTVKAAVSLTLAYSKGLDPTNFSATPEFHDLVISDLHLTASGDPPPDDDVDLVSSSAKWTYLECTGLTESPIDTVHFHNVHVAKSSDLLYLTSSCSFCTGDDDDDDSYPRPCFLAPCLSTSSFDKQKNLQ